MKQAIIIYGNPVDGLSFIGPFDCLSDAAAAGNIDPNIEGDWWISELEAPDAEDAS